MNKETKNIFEMTNEEAKRKVRGYLTDILPSDCYDEINEIIKALEQQPSEDCISREEAINETDNLSLETSYDNEKVEQMLRDLPSVKPQYTDEEIDKMQEIEQAYVDKMVELAVEEVKRPKGKWIDCKCSRCNYEVMKWNKNNFCPKCGSYNGGEEDADSD